MSDRFDSAWARMAVTGRLAAAVQSANDNRTRLIQVTEPVAWCQEPGIVRRCQ
ncbi:MAG: hypothetical protein OXC91_00590 [Rhodobacteraceae bacterium]|nr:hypothetical protein [Paracoccaceae bacterium]